MGENKDYLTYSDDKGSVNISSEVIATIAAGAALDVEGVAGLTGNIITDISGLVGKKGLSKGIKIRLEENAIKADIYIAVDIGHPINEVAENVQKAVKSAIESTTAFAVDEANVHVCEINLKNA